ncbi:MAG: 16S rRNA (guanine(966)-N(2))-methyltransferase RsmD [Clostridia bacterium]|nr:16S rRNA (guanine(966)-N(2))-methyltransferase RsmD [Clostridia bacterium]
MRVIAGSAKGKRIESIEGILTRPTLDRVKEAMFGSIQFELPGADVLDLFGGSGALAIEALSRGARSAVVNDKNPACVKMIEKNLSACGFSDKARVTCEDFVALIGRLSRTEKRFGFVFIDAPYADGTGREAMELCFRNDLVSEDGCVILEHSRSEVPTAAEGLCELVKTKNYGKCAFSVYKRL